MATLYDLIEPAQYTQVFSIYIWNIYGQYLPVARGTRQQMRAIDVDSGEEILFEHLMDKVEYYVINKSGVMVVFLRDENFNNRVEEQYSDDYVKNWKNNNPDTRPWLHAIETEEYTDKYISKFPTLSE